MRDIVVTTVMLESVLGNFLGNTLAGSVFLIELHNDDEFQHIDEFLLKDPTDTEDDPPDRSGRPPNKVHPVHLPRDGSPPVDGLVHKRTERRYSV